METLYCAILLRMMRHAPLRTNLKLSPNPLTSLWVTCHYDLIPKMKESLHSFRFRTVPEILLAFDRSMRNIKRAGLATRILGYKTSTMLKRVVDNVSLICFVIHVGTNCFFCNKEIYIYNTVPKFYFIFNKRLVSVYMNHLQVSL